MYIDAEVLIGMIGVSIVAMTIGALIGIILAESKWKNIIQNGAVQKDVECVRGKYYTFKEVK